MDNARVSPPANPTADRSTVDLRGVRLGHGRPKIIVPIEPRTAEDVAALMEPVLCSPADLVEWRVDAAASTDEARRIAGALSAYAARRCPAAGEQGAASPQAGSATGDGTPSDGGASHPVPTAPSPDEHSGDADCVACGSDRAADPCGPETNWPRNDDARRLPILLTYRTDREGGAGTLADAEYASLVAQLLIPGIAAAVDVEYRRSPAAVRTIMEAANSAGAAVVASFHDFGATPPRREILGHLRAQSEAGADVLKVSFTPNSPVDVAILLASAAEATEAFGKPVIAISMGSLGLVSRVAAQTFGSAATFGTVGRASAPGQIPAAELSRLLAVFDAAE